MNGKKADLTENGLRYILKTEFGVTDEEWEMRKAECALEFLEVYDSVEDFLETTGWGKDNPELQSEGYLIENRICRWIEGKFYYFSRLLWETGGAEE